MTKNSFLCNFIKNNPDNWQEILSSKPYFIRIKTAGPLAIFNYDLTAEEIFFEDESILDENGSPMITRWGRMATPLYPGDEWYEKSTPYAPDGNMYKIGATIDANEVIHGEKVAYQSWRCDFTLPETQEARGIIINYETCEVVCWPFRKFGNYGESYADEIDWSTARTQEKIDGSIMKVWWNTITNDWQISSNAMIDAKEAELPTGDNFYTLFMEGACKNKLDFSKLEKIKTYIFELIGPLNRVVIKYDEVDIYHIGTRNNITGEESNDDIGVKKPKEYPLNSLDACVKAAEKLCGENSVGKYDVEHEGFVVVDGNWNRIKIKSPEYVLVHHALNGGILSKKKIIQLILENEYEEYLTYFPKYRDTFDEHVRKMDILKQEINETIILAQKILDDNKDASKKEIAELIKSTFKNRAGWAFSYVNYGNTTADIIGRMSMSELLDEFEKIDI